MSATRRWGFWAAALALLLVVAIIGGGPAHKAALDPRSNEPDGTHALVLLMQSLGAKVDIVPGLPGVDDNTALLLQDQLGDGDRANLAAWVRRGGVLVVTDPSSPFAPKSNDALLGGLLSGTDFTTPRGECDISALVDVEELYTSGGATYVPDPGDGFCFADSRGAYVVARSVGAGAVVAVGSAAPFENSRLAHSDNSVLADALLNPLGSERIAYLEAPVAGRGTTTLSDLIDHRYHLFAAELAIAFVLYALWRARRLGRPVAEPQPVPIAGSELVSAVGGLLQLRRSPADAALLLRAEFRRTIGDRVGLPPDAPPEVFADVVARAGAPRDDVMAALTTVVDSDAALVALARTLDSIRQEVLHGQPAPR